MKQVVKIAQGTYILKDAQATVSFAGGEPIDTIAGGKPIKKGDLRIAPWGAGNLLPQELFKLVWDNHLKPQLITKSRDFLIGSRLGVFRRVIENKQHQFVPESVPEIEDWLELVEADKYMRRAGWNLEFINNLFATVTLNRKGGIDAIQAFDCTDVRAAAMDAKVGRIEDYVIHPDWTKYKASESMIVPAWDKANPTRFGQFMVHGRDEIPGQPYYAIPPWYGTRNWTIVSNKIPRYHISGLDNQYNIKYHIQIPANYFEQYGDIDAQEKAEEALLEEMNQFLSGVDNVNKAFVSKYATDAVSGKEIPGWKILAIEDKNDTAAYIELDKQANTAHASGHGIDPSLAGIDQNSKLGGSGSEKRISYQLHIALNTPNKRKILLDVFNTVAKRILGWDRDLYVGIVDMDVTTIAENKSGMEPKVNQAQ